MVGSKREQNWFLLLRARHAILKQYFFSAAIHLEVIKFNEFHLFIGDGTPFRMCCAQHRVFFPYSSPPNLLKCEASRSASSELFNSSDNQSSLGGSHSGCCIKHFSIDSILISNHLSILLSKLSMHNARNAANNWKFDCNFPWCSYSEPEEIHLIRKIPE